MASTGATHPLPRRGSGGFRFDSLVSGPITPRALPVVGVITHVPSRNCQPISCTIANPTTGPCRPSHRVFHGPYQPDVTCHHAQPARDQRIRYLRPTLRGHSNQKAFVPPVIDHSGISPLSHIWRRRLDLLRTPTFDCEVLTHRRHCCGPVAIISSASTYTLKRKATELMPSFATTRVSEECYLDPNSCAPVWPILIVGALLLITMSAPLLASSGLWCLAVEHFFHFRGPARCWKSSSSRVSWDLINKQRAAQQSYTWNKARANFNLKH